MKNRTGNKIRVSEERSTYYDKIGVIDSILPNPNYVAIKFKGLREPVIMDTAFIQEAPAQLPELRRWRRVPNKWD